MVYGYARISTAKQDIERQIRNIMTLEPSAKIYQEVFTGTKTTGRKELQKLLSKVMPGDTIIFDSVSRMSRNAKEGFELYKKLYDEGINLVYINEPYINTNVYRDATKTMVPMTGTDVDVILHGVNEYLITLAEQQIKIAFEQAQKERDDLSERTKQGIETARRKGKQIGRARGTRVDTKKAELSKKKMLKYSKAFGGSNTDKDLISMLGIDKNTYYKYKRELLSEMA
ncbi:MAG: recombinase family protein [Lachnospiraceae bacterium]|nr:recombinase family protein [Lachnospiraceae bacterium]